MAASARHERPRKTPGEDAASASRNRTCCAGAHQVLTNQEQTARSAGQRGSKRGLTSTQIRPACWDAQATMRADLSHQNPRRSLGNASKLWRAFWLRRWSACVTVTPAAQRFCQEQARIGCGRSPTNPRLAKQRTGPLVAAQPGAVPPQTPQLATKRKLNRRPKTLKRGQRSFKRSSNKVQTAFKEIRQTFPLEKVPPTCLPAGFPKGSSSTENAEHPALLPLGKSDQRGVSPC
jgi:hypothetical protein